MLKILRALNVRQKILVIELISLAIIVLISLYGVSKLREMAFQERQQSVENQVQSVVSLVDYYARLAPRIGEEEAKQRAIEAIKSLRYDNGNYFWVMTANARLVLHPLRPEMTNQDMSQVRDGSGHFHWQQMAQVVQRQGAGFVEYTFVPPNGPIEDKISYVAQANGWNWVIGTGIIVNDINQTVYHNALFYVGFALAGVVITLLFSSIIGKNITDPLALFVTKVQRAAQGDMTVRFNPKGRDEIASLGRSINSMIESTHQALITAKQSAMNAAEMASSIASASEETATSTQSQRMQLEQLATAMNEMNATIRDVAQNAEQTAASTDDVANQALSCNSMMERTEQNIEQLSQEVSQTDQLVEALRNDVAGINEIVDVIQAISEQTNLLALNAAIEAARAGEQGRGFAVVADEVRHLAGRTQQSTHQIQQTIESLIARAGSASQAMKQCHSRVTENVQTATETKQMLKQMVTELTRANDMVTQIATAAEQQDTVAEEMNSNVSHINLSADHISQSAQDLAEQSQHLADSANQLDEQLQRFKV
ncbi:cache domain-containing protein [Vibrio metschnikovii]|uniref:methyl-accepting chemotaxis protein n=1 Tax=Vibrio metschnikovii TaxID=28172 RepID=UPI0037534380|nr:cache domain-containing protein [Vibrio metschnikovii]